MAEQEQGKDEECRWNRCPVCGSDQRESYVAFPQMEFVECKGCATVYKSCEPKDLRPAGFYEAPYFHERRSHYDRRFKHRVRKARRLIQAACEFIPARTLLDVGCSFGYVLQAGASLGLQSAGLDVSEYAVTQCRQKGFRAEVGSLEEMPWHDSEFDLVILRHVLEHTPDPKRALTEIRRITTPHSVVVIIVPNLRYWKGIYRRKQYCYFRPDDLGIQHYVYYSADTLRRLLQGMGFQAIAATKVFYRRKVAARGLLHRLAEAARYLGIAVWQGLASLLLLRREVFIIARREDEKQIALTP